MALVLANRVQETTATTGTGPVTLAGAVSGYQSFAAIGNGNTTYYTIVSGTNWEVGIGTYTAAGTVLARTTILSSSAAGAAITLAGTSTVFVAYPAEDAIADGYGTLPVANGGTGANTLTSGYLAKGNGTSAVSASVVYDDGTNVGIGTAVPTSRVTISNGNSTAPALNILGGGPNQGWLRLGNNADIKGGDDYLGMTFTVGAAEHMRLDASGNVGIGTSAPGAKLDVNGSAIRVTNSIGYNSSSAVRLDIGAANDASVNASAAYQWSMNTAGNANGQSLVFSAYRRADTTLEAMRLDGSGNLGIGTAVPTSRVTISNGNSTAPALNILGGGPNQGWLRLGNNADIKGGDDYLGMTFTVGAAERMRLDGSGNLGIGTSAPLTRLNVEGGSFLLRGGTIDIGPTAGADGAARISSSLASSVMGTLIFSTQNSSAVLTEAMRIDSSGNIGIGTSAPVSRLNVITAVGTDASQFSDNTNYTLAVRSGGAATALLTGTVGSALAFGTNNTEKMRLDSSGNLGIGTSAPRAALSISRSTSTASVAASASIVLSNRNTTLNGGIAGGIFIDTYRDVADPQYTGGIWFTRTSQVSNFSSSSDIVFGAATTVDANQLPAERMRINSSGNVGIGTSTPQAKLAVATASSTGSFVSNFANHLAVGPNVGTVDGSGLGLGFNTTTDQSEIVSIAPNVAWKPLAIYSSGVVFNAVSGVEAMRITSSGNVGIGTSAPTAQLHINNAANATLLLQSGGAGAPIISLNTTGVGQQRITANTGSVQNMAFEVASSERMRIDASGNVGIGNTPSGTYKLQVTGAAYASSMVLGAALPVASGGTGVTTSTGTGSTVLSTAPALSGATLNDGYTEEVFAVTGTTPALSPTNGSIQTWTLTASSTPTAGTWAAGQSMTLMIDDGTAYTVTWTSLAVTWKTDAGVAPTLNLTGFTVIQLWKVGTVIYGARVGNA